MMANNATFSTFDDKLFRIVSYMRQPAPGVNWNQYHIETKNMLIVFLSEYTSATHHQICPLFGQTINNSIVKNARKGINPDAYKEFRLQMLDLMQI